MLAEADAAVDNGDGGGFSGGGPRARAAAGTITKVSRFIFLDY